MSGLEVVTFEPNHPSADYHPFYTPLDVTNLEIRLPNCDPSSDGNEAITVRLLREVGESKITLQRTIICLERP